MDVSLIKLDIMHFSGATSAKAPSNLKVCLKRQSPSRSILPEKKFLDGNQIFTDFSKVDLET